MQITKYPQSTLLLKKEGAKILIDPGSFFFEKYDVGWVLDVAAVLYTHQHFDHLDQEKAQVFAKEGILLFGNFDVAKVLTARGLMVNEVFDRKPFLINTFEITPVFLPHCKMVDGSGGPPNNGYVIDNLLFHPGDGIELEDFRVKKAAIPIAGPTIDYKGAWRFVESLNCKTVIPIHFSNPRFPATPGEFVKQKPMTGDVEVIVLRSGQSAEI